MTLRYDKTAAREKLATMIAETRKGIAQCHAEIKEAIADRDYGVWDSMKKQQAAAYKLELLQNNS
jgi:hypothetical protein